MRGQAAEDTDELTAAGDVLFAGGRIAAALRAGHQVVFVRADLPAELAEARGAVERALVAEGLTSLDRDSSLAQPLARERLGIEAGRWDLWGRTLADVFAVLAARGGTGQPAGGAAADSAGAGVVPPAGGGAEDLSSGAGPAVGDARGEAGAATDADAVSSGPAGAPSPWRSRSRLSLLAVALVAAVAAAVFAATGLDRAGDQGVGADPSASASAAVQLVDYRDPQGRFTLQHPETWEPLETNNPDIALVLLGPEGGSMLVRLVPLETPIDPANIEDVKAVTDVVVQAPGVGVVEQKPVELGDAPGYYYLYTFMDEETRVEGVHSHFFLFRDSTMHTLVFQALPSESFEGLADDFDRIAQSYQILK